MRPHAEAGSQASKEELDALLQTKHSHVTNLNFYFDFFDQPLYFDSVVFILILICLVNCRNSFVNCLFYMFNALENLHTFRSHRTLSSNAGLHGGPHHKASKAGVFRELGWAVGPEVGTACWGALLCWVDSKLKTQKFKQNSLCWLSGKWGVQSSKWHMRLCVFSPCRSIEAAFLKIWP